MSDMIMTTSVIATNEQMAEPTVIEIIESVDSPTRQRSRLALIPARHVAIQFIHLKPDEFIVAEQPREQCPAQ
jgi:hypothetical protein